MSSPVARARLCRRRVAVPLFLLCTVASLAAAQSPHGTPTVLTLRGLLDSIRSHPTSLAAESRVRAAQGGRVTAGTVGNPMIAYQVDQTPFPGGRPLAGLEREAMTTATLPLEFLYQRGARVSRANAELRAAQSDAIFARQQLGLEAAAAYYRTALAQLQVATTRELLGWLDTLSVYNRSRVQEGVAAEADLLRSELERDRIAGEAAMQEAELARARATLASYLAPSSPAIDELIVAVDDAPFSLPDFARNSAPTTAATPGTARSSVTASLDARPDVRAARERVAASNAAVASERSMLIRQLGATIGTMQTGHTSSMIAGVSVPVPLFDQNRGEIERASAERDVATYELASHERVANAELRGAADAARILTDRASMLARHDSSSFLARADESRRIALGAYREGAVPLFQVIDAARLWVEARMTYYQVITAQQQSVLALIVAQGLDLSTAFPTMSSRGENPR